MSDVDDLACRHWDAIVVGTGMGGATIGYALARAGWQVLFVERGGSPFASSEALRGDYAERWFPAPSVPVPQHADLLIRAGREAAWIEDGSGKRSRKFVPFIGSGAGGSSALYGMALERFFPADFEPRQNFPGVVDTTLPEAWPVSYAEMAPYYAAAERLYRVQGSRDPLRPTESGASGHVAEPPPLTAAGDELVGFLRGKGLHPYRLPLACDFVRECECCQGYLCAKGCKNDAGRICLQPALTEHGASLIDRCTVVGLEASRKAVTGVVGERQGARFVLRGRHVILAAGALATPALLLGSAGSDWPQGLANDSGMVGRNLMRHQIDLYALSPQTSVPWDNRRKELAFNDFYQVDGEKLGSVQSLGRLPPAEMLLAAMEQDMRDDFGRVAATLFRLGRPAIEPFLRRLSERRLVLAATLEDLPYADNRIELAGSASDARLVIRYRLRDQDWHRVGNFRTRVRKALAPYSTMLIKQADNNQRIAHVCGTCRFGEDPATSVLDRFNRAHGLANLHVVDASFFPSSGGTNPALTIAANALRVADALK